MRPWASASLSTVASGRVRAAASCSGKHLYTDPKSAQRGRQSILSVHGGPSPTSSGRRPAAPPTAATAAPGPNGGPAEPGLEADVPPLLGLTDVSLPAGTPPPTPPVCAEGPSSHPRAAQAQLAVRRAVPADVKALAALDRACEDDGSAGWSEGIYEVCAGLSRAEPSESGQRGTNCVVGAGGGGVMGRGAAQPRGS